MKILTAAVASRSLRVSACASEISEIITHLAFYSDWANAMSAVAVAKDVFSKRGIGVDRLPPASGGLLPNRSSRAYLRNVPASGFVEMAALDAGCLQVWLRNMTGYDGIRRAVSRAGVRLSWARRFQVMVRKEAPSPPDRAAIRFRPQTRSLQA